MKLKLTVMIAAALAATAFADIEFLGGLVGVSSNWAGGVLPTTAGDPGVIGEGDIGQVGNYSSSTSEVSVVGLYIRQDGGTVGSTSYRGSEVDATTWTVNGGAISGNGVQLKNGSVMTLNSGGSITAASGRDIVVADSTFSMNGGTLTVGDEFSVTSSGTFNLNGGIVTAGKAGTGFNAAGTFNLNSGSFTVGTWGNFEKLGDRVLNFGAGPGSVSIDTFFSFKTTLDWDSASDFELTITGADSAYYEDLWTNGVLTMDGTNTGTFAESGFDVAGSTLRMRPDPNEPPSAPVGLAATDGLSVVALDWNDSGGDVASYSVYRSTTSGSYAGSLVTGLTVSEYSDTSVTAGTTYYYVVTAVGTNSLESGFSNEDSATPYASAETTFIGGSTNNFISNPANWDNGLPVGAGKQGTISTNAGFDSTVTHTGYLVTHSSGTLSAANGLSQFALGAGSVWVMDGASAEMTNTRGLNLNGAQFTLNQGQANLTANSSATALNGASTLTINGGSMLTGKSLYLSGSSTLTITNGSLSTTGDFGKNRLSSGNNVINIFGGTVSVGDQLRFGKTGSTLTINLGGSTAGTLTALDYVAAADDQENIDVRKVNWVTGSQIAMTLTEAAVNWAEVEWNAGRLTYNGQGTNELNKTWAQVTTAGGLGTGANFAYSSATKTLSLVSTSPTAGYDLWAAGWAPDNIGAATNDFDGDGFANLYEYGVDGDPTDDQDQGTAPIFTQDGDSFIYVHPMRSDDGGLTYTVETTTNLLNSASWSATGYTVGGTLAGDPLDRVTNQVDTVENEKFIRLKIEL
jgi:hypothetical protein